MKVMETKRSTICSKYTHSKQAIFDIQSILWAPAASPSKLWGFLSARTPCFFKPVLRCPSFTPTCCSQPIGSWLSFSEQMLEQIQAAQTLQVKKLKVTNVSRKHRPTSSPRREEEGAVSSSTCTHTAAWKKALATHPTVCSNHRTDCALNKAVPVYTYVHSMNPESSTQTIGSTSRKTVLAESFQIWELSKLLGSPGWEFQSWCVERKGWITVSD